MKKEKYLILTQASFSILSCLIYCIIFRKSRLKSSTMYRISGFGSFNPFSMILLSIKEMVRLISSLGNYVHSSNMLSKLAIDPLALQVFGCIAKQFLQIFLLSVDCPFIDVCCILNIFRETMPSVKSDILLNTDFQEQPQDLHCIMSWETLMCQKIFKLLDQETAKERSGVWFSLWLWFSVRCFTNVQKPVYMFILQHPSFQRPLLRLAFYTLTVLTREGLTRGI